MAKSIEEILGKEIRSLKELREEIKRLQDSIASADPTSKEFKDTVEKLTAAQTQLNNVTKAGKQDVDAATDSIVGMEKEYKNMYNIYKMMTEEQRKSPMGKKMAEDLKDLSDKLNDTKKQVGNWKDNIGRYSESIIDAFTKMGASLGGLEKPLLLTKDGFRALGNVLKGNPIFLIASVIAGVVNILGKLKEAVGANEELQRRWNYAMAAFEPIMTWLTNAVDKLAQGLVWTVEQAVKAWNWIQRIFKRVGTGEETAGQVIERRKQALKDLEREYKTFSSEQGDVISNLRREASETKNVTERNRLLSEAKERQLEVDSKAVEIAQERLDIAKAESDLTPDDTAAKDALNDLEVQLNEAKSKLNDNQRMYNKLMQAGTSITIANTKAVKDNTDAVDELAEKALEIYNRTVEDNKTEVEKLTEKYNEEKALLEKYQLDTTLLTKQYNEKLLDLEKKAVEERIAARRKEYDEAVGKISTNTDAAVSLLRNIRFADEKEIPELKEQLGKLLGNVVPPFTKEEINRILRDVMNPETVEGAIADLIERLSKFKYEAAKKAFAEGDKGVTIDDVMATMDEYTSIFVSREELAATRVREVWEATISTFDQVNTSILTVVGSYSQLIQQEMQSGKITKQEAEKKKKTLIALEKVMLAVNIAQIAASTAVGIQDVWANYAAELKSNTRTFGTVLGAAFNAKSLAAAIIRTAGLATMGAANIAAASMGTIAKVRSIEAQGTEAGATGVAAAPAQIDSTPFSYTRTVQTQDEIDQLNRPIWVSVKDIDSAQANVRVTDQESTF